MCDLPPAGTGRSILRNRSKPLSTTMLVSFACPGHVSPYPASWVRPRPPMRCPSRCSRMHSCGDYVTRAGPLLAIPAAGSRYPGNVIWRDRVHERGRGFRQPIVACLPSTLISVAPPELGSNRGKCPGFEGVRWTAERPQWSLWQLAAQVWAPSSVRMLEPPLKLIEPNEAS